MKAAVSALTEKVRTALDYIAKDAITDDFTEDVDAEIRQALVVAADQIVAEAPYSLLAPLQVTVGIGTEQDYDVIQTQYTDGHGELVVPDDFLRLGRLKLKSWAGTVTELMTPDTDEAKRQATRWGRGTPQKPKAMMQTDKNGNQVLTYWTAGRYSNVTAEALESVYDHEVEVFAYCPTSSIITEDDVDYLRAACKDACKKNIVYRAAAIFLESRKETEGLVDRLYKESTF